MKFHSWQAVGGECALPELGAASREAILIFFCMVSRRRLTKIEDRIWPLSYQRLPRPFLVWGIHFWTPFGFNSMRTSSFCVTSRWFSTRGRYSLVNQNETDLVRITWNGLQKWILHPKITLGQVVCGCWGRGWARVPPSAHFAKSSVVFRRWAG